MRPAIKYIAALFAFTVGLMVASSTFAINQSDPVAMLQSIANNMINQLKVSKATLKSNPQLVYSIARRYVVPYANLEEMSRRVLPPQIWNSASASQRAQFKSQFTTLLIRTYASALSSYQDQSVDFYPVRGGYQNANTVEVSSQIVSSQRPSISVTYRLVRSGSVWRLFDMSVEGVSLIESFRSQFSDILANGDMNTLLKRMSSHNTR
jgi:phospholipid transport system substrate-binding protein